MPRLVFTKSSSAWTFNFKRLYIAAFDDRKFSVLWLMSSVLLDVHKGRHKLLWGALPPPSHPQLLALPPPTWSSKHLAHLSTQRTSEQEGPGQTSPPGHGSASGSRIWPALARGQNREMFHRGDIYCLVLIKRLPVLLAVQDKEIKVQTRKVAHSWSHRKSVTGPEQCLQPCVPAGL